MIDSMNVGLDSITQKQNNVVWLQKAKTMKVFGNSSRCPLLLVQLNIQVSRQWRNVFGHRSVVSIVARIRCRPLARRTLTHLLICIECIKLLTSAVCIACVATWKCQESFVYDVKVLENFRRGKNANRTKRIWYELKCRSHSHGRKSVLCVPQRSTPTIYLAHVQSFISSRFICARANTHVTRMVPFKSANHYYLITYNILISIHVRLNVERFDSGPAFRTSLSSVYETNHKCQYTAMNRNEMQSRLAGWLVYANDSTKRDMSTGNYIRTLFTCL